MLHHHLTKSCHRCVNKTTIPHTRFYCWTRFFFLLIRDRRFSGGRSATKYALRILYIHLYGCYENYIVYGSFDLYGWRLVYNILYGHMVGIVYTRIIIWLLKQLKVHGHVLLVDRGERFANTIILYYLSIYNYFCITEPVRYLVITNFSLPVSERQTECRRSGMYASQEFNKSCIKI